MTNHYHLLLETPDANLSLGMRQLNGVFTQLFNRKHRRVGHLLQGRYKAILIDKDSYLLEVSRYIVLNPVRPGMVDTCSNWPWSSYNFTCNRIHPPVWLAADQMLLMFANNRSEAISRYQGFVSSGVGKNLWSDLKQQLFLGSDDFVQKMQSQILNPGQLQEVPAAQKRPAAKPLSWYELQGGRNEAIQLAFASGSYTMAELSRYFGLHYGTVSRIISGKSHK